MEQRGFDVEYTRTTDVYESPFQKATEGNEAEVDLFVSIHRNAFPQANQASGVETLVYDESGMKYELAQEINKQLETLGFRNLGVKERPNLVVLKRTKMPAILAEVGFINSDTDNKLFDENFQGIAEAIANSIQDIVGTQEETKEENYYRVQTGLFRNWNNAVRMQNELQAQDFPAYIDMDGPYYRVQVGPYDSLQEAAEAERSLKRAGYATLVIR